MRIAIPFPVGDYFPVEPRIKPIKKIIDTQDRGNKGQRNWKPKELNKGRKLDVSA